MIHKQQDLKYSDEQYQVIMNILQNKNVVVNAVAGSGKTTTIFGVCKHLPPEKKVLVLTFNRDLRTDMTERAEMIRMQEERGLSNMEIHTFHSFFRRYVDPNTETDKEILMFFRNMNTMSGRRKIEIPQYDLLVVDENQDMTSRLYKIVLMAIIIQRVSPQLLLLGDKWQSIYVYQGSDYRYLTLGNILLSETFLAIPNQEKREREWVECTLRKSYRCSPKICDFVNMCMKTKVLEPGILTNTEDVAYYRANLGKIEELGVLATVIRSEVEKHGIENVMILASSIVRSTNAQRLVNKFIEMYPQYPVFVPSSDTDVVADSDFQKDKLVFSTIHSAKGLGRFVLFFFGFNRRSDELSLICSNECYTGLTRCVKKLYVIENCSGYNECHEFVDRAFVVSQCETNLKESWITTPPRAPQKQKTEYASGVTDVLKSFSSEKVFDLTFCISSQVQSPAQKKIEIPVKIERHVRGRRYFESVSEIVGTALPQIYKECRGSLDARLLECPSSTSSASCTLQNRKKRKKTLGHAVFQEILSSVLIEKSLKRTTEEMCKKTGFNHRLRQIQRFDWFDRLNCLRCVESLHELLASYDDLEYEVSLGDKSRQMHGSIDIVSFSENTIFEIKCVDKIKDEHSIQLTMYAYLYYKNHGKYPKCILYNVLTREKIEIDASASLPSFEHRLFQRESEAASPVFDEDFLVNCKLSVNEVLKLVQEEGDEDVQAYNLCDAADRTNLLEETLGPVSSSENLVPEIFADGCDQNDNQNKNDNSNDDRNNTFA